MQNPHITGHSIYLRPIEMDDRDRYVTWLNDAEVRAGVGRVHPINKLGQEDFLKSTHKDPNLVLFAIVERSTDQHIGGVGLHDIDSVHRSCSFGILIGNKEKWGKGYATEATRMVVNYAFSMLNLNRVQLRVFSFNTRAIALYERIGFVREGVCRQSHYHAGAYHDEIIMSVLREEWKTQFSPRGEN